MKRPARKACPLLFFFPLMNPKKLSALLAIAAHPVISVATDVTQQLDSLFESRYPNQTDPGAAVVIARGDSIIYERYFGIADIQSHHPVTADTRFNIASISKQFTVVALLQQGIDIDSPVSGFFDFPQEFWHQVTLRHLASHTSGIHDSRDRSDRSKCIYATDTTSEAYFPFVDSLKFEPGTAYDYLNPSFILLARVVEQNTGMEFTEYMQEKVFGPTGMASTYYFDPDATPDTTAHGYIPTGDGSWKEYDYGEETFFATRPDGGIYSTARDMLRWERALANGTVLDIDALREAYSPQIEVSGSQWCDYQNRPDTYYGLGWFIDRSNPAATKVYHTGDNGGFQAYVAKYPEQEISIIVLENRNDRDRWEMAKAIDKILLDSPSAGAR